MDELDFEYLSTFPDGDPAGKALVFLKAGISTFAKKNYRDEPTLKLIVAALTQAPLLVPVEVDFDELLMGLNPEELSPNQELQADLGNGTLWRWYRSNPYVYFQKRSSQRREGSAYAV